MEAIQIWVPVIAQGLGYLVMLATFIVKLTPGKSDDVTLKNINSTFWRYVNMLPTLGVNPRTKKIEDAYKEMLTNA